MRLAFILGTRPELIKTAPLILEARTSGIECLLVHSGQHYDEAMNTRFFEELSLPAPDVQLHAGGKPYAEQVSYLIRALYQTLMERKPDAIVVQGDTVTVMCAALAAHRAGIPVIHHEAGLRSRDQHMSEEYHRIITDHLSEILCAPTEDARVNLRLEGAPEAHIHLTGNTVVDAVRRFTVRAAEHSDVLERHGLSTRGYFVLTFHRAENVDEPARFAMAMESFARVAAAHPDRPIIFPVHPRVDRRRLESGLVWPEGIRAIEPLGYLDMLQLLSKADLIMTDSGGLQEEASILGVPCVTLRDSTERPESVAAGLNVIAGIRAETVLPAVAMMRGKSFAPVSLYGDGHAARRIIQIIAERIGSPVTAAPAASLTPS